MIVSRISRRLLTILVMTVLFAGGLFPLFMEPSCGLIAFTSNRDGNDEIYVMRDDGTLQINLTNDSHNERDPAWSPNGKKIAFTSNRDGNDEIYLMDGDGKNQRRMTTSPGSDRYPAWSPNGKKIAFTKRTEYHYDIYVMDADGSNQVNITNHPSENWNPTWSPDGKNVAFASDRKISQLEMGDKCKEDFFGHSAGDWVHELFDGSQVAFTMVDGPRPSSPHSEHPLFKNPMFQNFFNTFSRSSRGLYPLTFHLLQGIIYFRE